MSRMFELSEGDGLWYTCYLSSPDDWTFYNNLYVTLIPCVSIACQSYILAASFSSSIAPIYYFLLFPMIITYFIKYGTSLNTCHFFPFLDTPRYWEPLLLCRLVSASTESGSNFAFFFINTYRPFVTANKISWKS